MDWIDVSRAVVVAGVVATLGGGCTLMPNRESPLPKSGPTMAEIYRQHLTSETDASAPTPLPPARPRLPSRAADDDEVVAERRAVSDPLQARFARLANPDLVMYVFPHLSAGRHPVPGYRTVFAMYESVHYALPGEGRMAPDARPVRAPTTAVTPDAIVSKRLTIERIDPSAPTEPRVAQPHEAAR